jgi:hypothetical protein
MPVTSLAVGEAGARLVQTSRALILRKTAKDFPQIGIGGAVARSPLPHHPACGSAPGGSRS